MTFIPSVGEKTEAPKGPLLAGGVRIQTWHYYRAHLSVVGTVTCQPPLVLVPMSMVPT